MIDDTDYVKALVESSRFERKAEEAERALAEAMRVLEWHGLTRYCLPELMGQYDPKTRWWRNNI